MSTPPALPSGDCDSSLPVSSTTLTAEGSISGTLDATRCTMPAICARSSMRPGCKLSSTEAEGFAAREKAVLIGQGQMHAGTLHGIERQDGAGQLAFQAALEIEAFLKLGDAELAVLHHRSP